MQPNPLNSRISLWAVTVDGSPEKVVKEGQLIERHRVGAVWPPSKDVQ